MSWLETLAIGAQIAEALGSAHDCGIIHRDIKPGNILIDPTGKPFVTDFGIAKVLSATTKLTVDGSRLGTPQYMSPERCKNKEITPASDIYSLGVLIYQAICGRLPYEANTPVELVAKIIGEDPVRITEYMPDIPESVDLLLAHMLDPNPKARPQSARTLLAMIERVRNGLPLTEGATSASKAIHNYRAQLERESNLRTPSLQPRTPAPKVPLMVRASRTWFQLSRIARLGLAGSLTLVVAGAVGVGAWQSARYLTPTTAFRAPQTDALAWSSDVAPFKVVNESQGVDIVRLALPGFSATRAVRSGEGGGAVLELLGQPGGAAAGQYAVARIDATTPGAELVLEPTPNGGENTLLLAANVGAYGAPGYLYSHRGRTVPVGAAPTVAGNATAAVPLGDGRWLNTHLQAGSWQLAVTAAPGHDAYMLPLPSGPVVSLASALDGSRAALVTGSDAKYVLWSIALAPGSTAIEIARGSKIVLAPEAFGDDATQLVAVVQEREGVPTMAMQISTADGQATAIAPALYAASVPGAQGTVIAAPDRAGNSQLWLAKGNDIAPVQLSFLGTGLADNFAVLDNGLLAAPVNGQAGVALVTLPSSSPQ